MRRRWTLLLPEPDDAVPGWMVAAIGLVAVVVAIALLLAAA